ncbi:dephospho-CoA kinase [Tamlana sp. 2201CG12-4]|uniref:dephospho-CoA kinase n=1 Tax=Tamlana sp. 2201CG12-4 TaxID=3112582 RepID=UPI002DC0531F|nr:dephospho-CoA kinase [Tamlana sp. 2201CG12-4]MEC3907689.1 dephospho-CoA kinase [Tamlana sp. 2201CG12-4]
MMIVGLTGGIGSGKTTVAKLFESYGVPVYIADEEAKKLMTNSKVIKRKLIHLFDSQAYIDDVLNKPYIANIIFNNKAYLQKMNAIVHPKVARHFEKWVLKQKAPYIIKEVAILFENGGYKACDSVITVVAPKEVRIKRLLERDHTTVEKIEAIMSNQWTDEQKVKHSNYVINNLSFEDTEQQVYKIHQQIMEKFKI